MADPPVEPPQQPTDEISTSALGNCVCGLPMINPAWCSGGHFETSKWRVRAARIAEADALFNMHAVDQQYVLQVHQVADWQDVVQRMQQAAMAQAAAASQAKGEPKGPGTGHAH